MVAFTCETEDDHPAYVPGWRNFGSNYDVNPAVLKWDWTRYFYDLSQLFRSKGVPVTWLIRVDNGPVRERMLDFCKNQMLQLRSSGDEIGAHIHTFTWDKEQSKWVQARDAKRETEIVRSSVEMFRSKLGFSPMSVRMGWHAMDNNIMKTLDDLNVLVDSSAVPRISCSGKFGERDNIYDWSRAPYFPYHPSYDDYQSWGKMRILEMPISALEANEANLFGNLVNKLSDVKWLVKLLPIAQKLKLSPHRSFYFSPWQSSLAHDKIIRQYSAKASRDGIAFLIGSFHACDILNPVSGDKSILFERYLSEAIEKISVIHNAEVVFATLSEMAKRYISNELRQ
jgi:hypothetical protein